MAINEFKCGDNHQCGICMDGCNKHTDKLNSYDWLADLPDNNTACDIVEVQFKPPRKGYFVNSNRIPLQKGDVVAVEASPGHDVGTVTMTGRLVPLQVKKANLKPDVELKRVYRKVKPVDMEKFDEAKSREHQTMIQSRQIAKDLGLKMKIGDVEYQGDCSKAIFYYIADERVDFRQLIKVLAERFRVRIEMKQIGARQEAGRIGGIGPCGRELCCATWMTSFVSVSTSAARFQDISLNPQKLAGQCAKLKCCLNYEVDQYVESLKLLPSKEISLFTIDNEYFFFKADILNRMITYSTDKHILVNEATITAKRAFDIILLNQKGKKPDSLLIDGANVAESKPLDLLEQDNISRFDKAKKKKRKKSQGADGQPKQQGNKPSDNAEQRRRDNEPRQRDNEPRQRDNEPRQRDNEPRQRDNESRQRDNESRQRDNNGRQRRGRDQRRQRRDDKGNRNNSAKPSTPPAE